MASTGPNQQVYLDFHATTPVDDRVLAAMLPYYCEKFGNIASQHAYGRSVCMPVQEARFQISSLIHAEPRNIVFTSGATESNGLAIKGLAEACADEGRHIITCATEHKSVLATVQHLARHGYEVTIMPVESDGSLDLNAVRAAIRRGERGTTQRTVLMSFMAANNEIGTLHPIKELCELARSHGVWIHVDAAQAVGKVAVDVTAWGADLVSLTAHKMYGPKGIGALYVRRGDDAPRITPQMHGGGQEGGLRSGTLPIPLVVGFGMACSVAEQELSNDITRITQLREDLWQKLQTVVGGVKLNGHPSLRLPGNLSVTFADVDGERLPLGMKEICVSSTSACSSGATQPSYVLKSIGLGDDDAYATLRIGLGRSTSQEDVDLAVAVISREVKHLRSVSRPVAVSSAMKTKTGTRNQ